MNMGLDPAILGAAVINGGNAARDAANDPTCTIQMHDGRSSKGLECIVQAVHHMSDTQSTLIAIGIIALGFLVVGVVALLDRR